MGVFQFLAGPDRLFRGSGCGGRNVHLRILL